MTLEEANQLLMKRRAAAKKKLSERREERDRVSSQIEKQPHKPTDESRSSEPVTAGWLRPLAEHDTSPAGSADSPLDASTNVHKTSTKTPETINIYSGVLTAILKTKQTAGGRVWLVLRARHAHEGASGKVSRAELQKTLENEFNLSWRRLQQIIEAGEGLFWTWGSEGNLYIHGAKRVARALGIKRLRGDRVTIALSDLTGSYKRAKATLWAAFHAGRGNNDPISRATQHEIMNVSERSQRQYSAENPDLIETKSNYSIDESHSAESAENHTFKHGKSSFQFTDYNGKQGRAGAQYRARQLPSTHVSKLATAPKGRTRKINKKLRTDRVNKVERGNSCEKIERRYYPNGAAAARAANRGNVGAQWRTSSTSKKDGLWSRI